MSDLHPVPLTGGVGAPATSASDVRCSGIDAPWPLKLLAAALAPTASSAELGPGRDFLEGGRRRLMNAMPELLNSTRSR